MTVARWLSELRELLREAELELRRTTGHPSASLSQLKKKSKKVFRTYLSKQLALVNRRLIVCVAHLTQSDGRRRGCKSTAAVELFVPVLSWSVSGPADRSGPYGS